MNIIFLMIILVGLIALLVAIFFTNNEPNDDLYSPCHDAQTEYYSHFTKLMLEQLVKKDDEKNKINQQELTKEDDENNKIK